VLHVRTVTEGLTMTARLTGVLGTALLLAFPVAAEAQRSQFVPLGFAGNNAVVFDLGSVRRTGDVVEASTQVWSDSVFVVEGTRAVRRDDRYRVHCGLGRIFDDGSVYSDSTGQLVGGEVPPVEAPPADSWTPITRGSMLASIASFACFADTVQKSRTHRVILIGEENSAYLRTIPSAVTVAPGDSVLLMRRTDSPINVRYGRPEVEFRAVLGAETDLSYQLDQVSREKHVQNILWVATPRLMYPNGFLAFKVRSDGREFIIPIHPTK
jgi:hypothetical protein